VFLAAGAVLVGAVIGCGAEPDQSIDTEATSEAQVQATGDACDTEEQMVTVVDVVESVPEMLDASDVVAEIEVLARFTRSGPSTAEDQTTYRMARAEVIEAFEGTHVGSVLEVFVTAAIAHVGSANPPAVLSETTDDAFVPGARLILGMHESSLGAGLELGGGAIVVDGSTIAPVDPCSAQPDVRSVPNAPRADPLYESVAGETPQEVRDQLHQLAAT
jgi:hypothetical protein